MNLTFNNGTSNDESLNLMIKAVDQGTLETVVT